jgi:hypothetical protein
MPDTPSITVKQLATVLGVLFTLAAAIGGVVAAYYQGMAILDDKIEEVEKRRSEEKLEAQRQYLSILNRLDLLEQNIDNRLLWGERAVEQLVDEVPDIIREHEYASHPVKKNGDAVRPPAKIHLAAKPAPVEKIPLRDPVELMQHTLPPPAAN